MKKNIIAIALSSMFLGPVVAFAEDSSAIKSTTAQEWRSYVEPMLPLGEQVVPLMADPQNPLLRQELYRMMFSEMSLAYISLFIGDAQYPDFVPVFNGAFNLGFPNVDASYYLAHVEGSGIYRISGYRGTVRVVDFQIGKSDFYLGGSTFPAMAANYHLDDRHVHIEKNGRFEVVLSAERPAGYKGDWWKLDSEATHVFVRQLSYDWLHEVDGRFAIERLDRPAIKPRQSAQEIQANLQKIKGWAENWTAAFLQGAIYRSGPVNKVELQDLQSWGTLTTQKFARGLFDLQPDEALIYETEIPKQCGYWSIMLTEMTWSAVDYMNRQSSLNGYTARLDQDGKFRAVISATDPGIPNWLDTAGYAKGTIVGRWTDCSSTPTPTVTKIKLADVRKYLPADTPAITAAARDAAIRLRREGAQLRRRW